MKQKTLPGYWNSVMAEKQKQANELLTKPYPMRTLLQDIANQCQWLKTVNNKWRDKCEENIQILQDHLPSGSGLDSGCTIDEEKSGYDRVVIRTSFHHMDEHGGYDGWTHHTITIMPCLAYGFTIKISGHNRNFIFDYLHDTFNHCLTQQTPL